MESLHLLIILWAVLYETYSLSSLKEISGKKEGSVWIPCYYDVKYGNSVKLFFYKATFGRRVILAQTEPISPARADDRITISDDKSQGIFTVTMRRLKKGDERHYYCGLKRESRIEEFDLYLKVDEGDYGLSINSNSNVFTGQEKGSLVVSCKYTYSKYVSFKKYWCKGRDFQSCQKLKRSGSNKRISITDDTTRKEFSVTMWGLQRTDTDWYWCAIEKAYMHERVPFYIRVTQVSETELLQTDTPITMTAYTYMTASWNSTEYLSEMEEVHSGHVTIALVIAGLLLLFLAAGTFTLTMKRNRRGRNQNESWIVQPQGKGTTEVKSGDVTYAVVSFQKRTKKEDPEPPSEDVQYAALSFQRRAREDTKTYSRRRAQVSTGMCSVFSFVET